VEVEMAVEVTAEEERAAVGVAVTAEGSVEVERAAAVTVAEGKAEGAMARGGAGPVAAVAMAPVMEATARAEAATLIVVRARHQMAAAEVAVEDEVSPAAEPQALGVDKRREAARPVSKPHRPSKK
jgi:hypothetical protein